LSFEVSTGMAAFGVRTYMDKPHQVEIHRRTLGVICIQFEVWRSRRAWLCHG